MITINTLFVPRYSRILLMLADGSSIQEIANDLHLGESTIKNDISRMKKIFGAKNVNNMIALAYQNRVLAINGSANE